MDKKILQQIKVGIFVSIGILLSMFAIFFVGERNLFEQYYDLYTHFDEISGLRGGAPVFLAGVPVGKVKQITFPKSLEEKGVFVSLEISTNYADRIRQDSEATIVTQGLLGDKGISISVGTQVSEKLKDGDLLKSKKGTSIESFAEKANEVIDDASKLLKNVNGLVGDIKQKDGMVHALIYDGRGKEILGNLAEVTRSAGSFVRDLKSSGVVQNFTAASKNMKATSENFKLVSEKIEKGEGSIGGLITDPTVYYDLKTLMGKANRSKLIQAVIRYTLSKNEKDTLK
ncbi:MAG: MlaD family protein [bacterium]